MLTASIHSSSLRAMESPVPQWLHLLPAGTLSTKDGRGPYRVIDPDKIIAASMADGNLPLDENHSTDLAAPKGAPSPARGWIVQLLRRSDGIWGRVEWTKAGKRIMEDRQYGGISPVIAHDKDGAITAILRASLTNTPNMKGLTSLHSEDVSQADRRATRAQLVKLLRLASATDDAIIAKVRQILAGPQSDNRSNIRAQLVQALRLGSVTDRMIAAKVRQVLAPVHRSFEEILADEPALQSSLGAADERVIALLGCDRGEYLKALHAQQAAGEEVSRHSAQASRVSQDGLTAADERVIQMMGLDRDAYTRSLKRRSSPS